MAQQLFLQLKKLKFKNKITSAFIKNIYFLFILSSISIYSQAQSYIQLGSGSSTASYFPLYYLYDYSYTQTIYTAAEMNAQGATTAATINKIYYKPTASVSTSNWKDWVIYMGNTTQTGFSNVSNYIPLANMTEVFNGQILANTTANSWIEITLSTPFNWDGTSNIVVAVDENTFGWGSSPNWAGYTLAPSSGSKGIYFYQDNTNINPATPAANSSGVTNIVAQIRFEGNLLPSCSGTPNAGTVPSTIGICPGQPLTLIDTGSTFGQSYISGQWQSSPGGQNTWTNIAGATTPTYTVLSAPAVATDYRYAVTCSAPGGGTAYSNVMTGTITPPNQCYCAPVNSNSTYYLNNFATTGGITNFTNNNSGLSPNGYGNYYNQYQVSQLPGSSINFTGSFGPSSNSFGVKIWVDWNQNGSFNDPGELVYTTSSYITSLSGSITVPTNATLGDTRMRIGVDYLSSSGPTDPCQNNNNYQEFEDYKFTVVALQNCTNATFPTNVNTTSNKDTLCLVGDVSLNINPLMPPVSGLTYQWQQASNAAGPYTNIGSAQTTPGYLATNVSTETYFRVNVICANTTTVLTSNPKHIVISNPQLLGVTDGERCGPGTVNLSATSGGNSTIYWYENPTGGPLLSSGNTFTTPFLNQTDTFYASAGAGGGGGSGTDSLNSMNGAGNGCGGGVMFDLIAINSFNIDSFKAKSNGSGNNIKIYYKSGTYVGSETNQSAWTLHETINMSYSASGYINLPLTNPLPINAGDTVGIYINYYSGYANGNGTNQTITNNDMTFKAGVGLCSDFGGLNNPRVFDGNIYYSSGSCESPRQAVIATINPVPDVNLGPNIDTCVDPGSSITLDAGTFANNPSYLWQNGTINQTRQVSTSGSYSVIVTNSFGCSGYDTVQVNIKPKPIVDLGPDTTICEGEVLELDAGPGPNAVAYFWNTGILSRTLFVDQSGTYSVLVTNSQGCVKSDTIQVTISGHIPTSDGIAVTNLGPKTFNFKAQNATGVVSYDWDFGDGSPHSFGSNPTHTYEHVGNYLVKLKILGSCGQINDSAYVYIVGIEDISNDSKSILLYPNPAQNRVQVQVAGELTMNKITVINTLGQKVYEQRINQQKDVTVSLNEFASGLYTIQVETNKGIINKKLEILK